MKQNELITANGQVLSLLQLSFSANHSHRYYAQLANKVNTMSELAFNLHLEPYFLTMTLDGFYRDLLKGDYKRYNDYSEQRKEEIAKSVPENENLGFIRTKMSDNEQLTVKDLYNILNYQMRQFRNGVAFKNLKKAEKEYLYIKTVEPHQDGVPHFHMMLYLPPEHLGDFQKDFKRFFVAPRNQLDVSFQTNIKNASGYIMKYITKSFRDVKSGRELDYLNAWFVKHRIMRCVTSRSTLPQWIYKKIAIYMKDWYYLTDILDSSNNSEWSYEDDYFSIYDAWDNRQIEYVRGELSVYTAKRLVFRAGEKKPFKPKSYKQHYEKTPTTWTKQKEYVPIYQNGKLTHYYKNGHIKLNKKHITQMSDFELMSYHNTYDVENDNYTHYLAVRNLMIDRNLLDAKKYNLDSFDFEEFIIAG